MAMPLCSKYPVFWSGGASDRQTFPGRKPTFGPEENLVRDFISRLQIQTPRGHKVALFKEPWLQSGAPDLVAVIWQPQRDSMWKPERLELGAMDLRILHWLVCSGLTPHSELVRIFGTKAHKSVDRLGAAEMIRTSKKTVQARPLSKLFAIKRIYAIEAKVSQLPIGLEQASLNRWFAQKSFILVPQLPRGSVFFDRACDLGVGVWCAEDAALDAREIHHDDGRPLSYASWLFNEWILRAQIGGDYC